jgi:hypothetical protein
MDHDEEGLEGEEEGVELEEEVEGEEGVEGARLVTLYPSSHLLLVSQATIQHVCLFILSSLESGLNLQPRIWQNKIPERLWIRFCIILSVRILVFMFEKGHYKTSNMLFFLIHEKNT